jgi:hypothetical protein
MDCPLCRRQHPVGQGCTQADTMQWEKWDKPTGYGWGRYWQGDYHWKQQGSSSSSSRTAGGRCRQCGTNEQFQDDVTCQVCSATNTLLNERVLLDTGASYIPQTKAFINSNHDINDRAKEHSVLWKAVNDYYSSVCSASNLLCGPTRKSTIIEAQHQFDDVCFSLAITGGPQPTQVRRWNTKDARTTRALQSPTQQSQASSSQPDSLGTDYQSWALPPTCTDTEGPAKNTKERYTPSTSPH